MAEDHVISVSAKSDNGSFQTLRSELQSATREVEKLGQALGALGHGSPISVAGVGARGEAAPPSFMRAAGAARAEGAGGAGGTMAYGVGGIGTAMQRAAQDAQGAARTINDTLRDAANAGEPHLRRLQQAVEAVSKAMQGVRAGGTIPGTATLPGAGPGMVMVGGMAPPPTGRGPSGTLGGAGAGLIPVAGMGGPAGPAGGWITSHPYASGAGPHELPLLQRNVSSFLPSTLNSAVSSMIPAGMRGAAMKYGPWAAAAYGAYKTYDWMTAAMSRSNVSNAEETINEQFYPSHMRAAAGQTFGNDAVSILQGNIGLARASRLALRDVNFQRLMSQDMTIRREQLNAEKAGLPSFQEGLTGERMGSTGAFTVKNIKESISSKTDQMVVEVTNTWGDALLRGAGKVWGVTKAIAKDITFAERAQAGMSFDSFGGRDDEKTRSRQEIAMTRSNAQTPLQMMKDYQQIRDAYYASDTMFNYLSSNLMGGAQGTMDMLRGAGLGQRLVKDQNGRKMGFSGDLWAANLTSRGLLHQAMMGRGQVAGTGGRGMIGFGDEVAGAIAGGFHNAGSVLGLGAQLGGGAPDAFFKAVQGAQGRGGLDVTGGSDLANFTLQALRQGSPGIGGAEAFQAIAGAAYLPGQSAAESVRAAQSMQGGVGFMQQVYGGKLDPLGQAIARRAAVRVAGNRGASVADELERLSANPVEMMQMIKSGNLPSGLKAMGIERKDLQDVLKEQNLQNVVRIVQRGLPAGTVAESAAKRLIATGGDIREAIFGHGGVARRVMGDQTVDRLMALRSKEKLTGKERAESDRLERQVHGVIDPGMDSLSRIMATASGGAASPEDVRSSLELQMGFFGPGRRARGAGAGDTIGKDTLERAATGAQGKLKTQESKGKAERENDLKEDMGKADLAAVALEQANQKMQGVAGMATDLAKTVGALEQALARAATGMNAFAKSIPKRL